MKKANLIQITLFSFALLLPLFASADEDSDLQRKAQWMAPIQGKEFSLKGTSVWGERLCEGVSLRWDGSWIRSVSSAPGAFDQFAFFTGYATDCKIRENGRVLKCVSISHDGMREILDRLIITKRGESDVESVVVRRVEGSVLDPILRFRKGRALAECRSFF